MVFSLGLGAFARDAALDQQIERHVDKEFADLNRPYVDLIVPEDAKDSHLRGTVVSMLGMAVIAGVGAYREAEKIAQIRGQPITKQEKEDLIKGVTNGVVGPASLVSFGAGDLAAKTAAPLTDSLKSPHGSALVNLSPAEAAAARAIVAASVSNIVMQAGMVTTDKLIDASMDTLTPDEQDKARKWLVNIAKGQLKVLSGNPVEGVKLEDQGFQGAGLFLKGASTVAIADFDGAWYGDTTGDKVKNVYGRVVHNERRNLWLYDTWREGIMTGKFDTNTAAMTAGALAGGSVGGVWGGVGGSLAGLALNSEVTPDWVNEKLDEKNLLVRKNTIRNGALKWCMGRISANVRLADNHNQTISKDKMTTYLDDCADARQNYTTIILDQLSAAYKKSVIASKREEAAKAAHHDTDAADQHAIAVQARDEFDKRMREFHDFYNEQKAALQAIRDQTKLEDSRKWLNDELDRLTRVDKYFGEVLKNIPADEWSCKVLMASSMRGFLETSWLKPHTKLVIQEPDSSTDPVLQIQNNSKASQ